MTGLKKIKSALLSVYYKDGLEPIVRQLAKQDITIYSTGGTQSFIESLGIQVVPVEELTSYPSILGGRVKTLHPKVFGGILGRRGHEGDVAQLSEYEIPPIDLVVVDLYPFEETVAQGGKEEEIIEKIDIGGISLIRAAAKNFNDVVIVPSKSEYPILLEVLEKNNAETTLDIRRKLALHAFKVSSGYDTAIANWFAGERETKSGETVLRYGENPHQKAVFKGNLDEIFEKLNGKEISYNNLLDIDAAVNLLSEFRETTFAILKHNNACGIASRPSVLEAWTAALASDPVSAFGGILICNAIIDLATANEINKLFFEVVIAPGYEPEALNILQSKTNRIILRQKPFQFPARNVRTALNGVLEQERDSKSESTTDLTTVTLTAPNSTQIDDLIFANKVVKHTKSNCIVLAKNKCLLASGTGQTSRVDALRQAIEKAQSFGFDLQGSVMASDAFFPFPDCVEIADQAGVKAVIQPGGSVKDQLSIDYCNQHEIAMVMTGTRHFKH
ncbi:MAG: bifunctional phosphoribosylaminoimidazolecarboxamide formyltransferase/IMP cyclohydrolase [Bacteroidia bacterium]|nr:bifunctional phosphoribosylaminoimidazolecarboxamide formyltransferase/IMP cyclohydrolase [Bacteroidia bacterium]